MANKVILKHAAVSGSIPETQLVEGELAYAQDSVKGGELHIGAIGAGSNILLGAQDSAKLAGNQTFTGTLELDPTDQTTGTDAITRGQAAAQLSAAWESKDSVQCATTSTLLVLTGGTYTATATTLTADANGAFPAAIDSITVTEGVTRILVKNEPSGGNLHYNNGIYVLSDAGSESDPWVLTRTNDANATDEVKRGMNCWVDAGTANALTQWINVAADGTLGATAITFEKLSGFGPITATGGLEINGNTLSVSDAGVGVDEINASIAGDGLGINGGTGKLEVKAGTGITSSTTLSITDAGVTKTHLTASVAGNGIGGGNNTALYVDVGDGLTTDATTLSASYGGTSTTILQGNATLDAGTWA
jgi:hypothetical protein